MEHVRTVKVTVHYLTTKRKRSYLERLTAKLTHAVRAWSGIIGTHGLRTRCDCSPFERVVGEETGLSAGFVQQARDKALWMRESYRQSRRRWKQMLSKAKRGKRWHEKLKRYDADFNSAINIAQKGMSLLGEQVPCEPHGSKKGGGTR